MPERLPIAHLPTPIDPLIRLTQSLGGPEIWIKRDDQTGLAFGGNKSRKLEYLLFDARDKGCKTLITRGALQSNHCRQTAAAAARFGFECILVLSGDPPKKVEGNYLLDSLFGAKFKWTKGIDPDLVLQSAFEEAQEMGAHPYLVPYGGSNVLGVFAYTQAIKEVIEQGHSASHIVFATSSGGTQAGLCLGAKLHGYVGKITGISVDEPAPILQKRIVNLANQTSNELGFGIRLSEEDVEIRDDYLGEGYAVMGKLEREAIRAFAQTEGLLLDPVYTGRAAGGMLELIRKGDIGPDDKVLFWHTGGTPAIFAYEDELL
jgi:D-cysteine desulfhydrase family pyridoxal phosphate-dependent enzyme